MHQKVSTNVYHDVFFSGFKIKNTYAIPNSQEHFLERIPTVEMLSNKSARKMCRLCHLKKMRRYSRYHCTKCIGTPGFCVYPCFKEFHELFKT